MAVVIDGTTGIATPGEAVSGNLSYTGTLTGGTGVVNLGSGQVYKDASGNVGIGTTSPSGELQVFKNSAAALIRVTSSTTGIAGIDFGDTDRVDSGRLRYDNSANALLFTTDLTERMRIDSSGNLLVGTTASNPGQNNSTTGVALLPAGRVFASSNSDNIFSRNSNGTLLSIRQSGTEVGAINVTTTATSYVTSSDYRLKEAIAPMTSALAKVALLKPVTYKWKSDGSDGQGFIAHELAEIEAGCVTGEKDAIDADGNPQYQGIDTSFLVATLTAAIQELKAIVDTQAISITALNERLTALEAPIV